MAKQPRTLAGRVVAITGAARGIGRATAVALVREGATVAIGDIDADSPSGPRRSGPARRGVRARRDRPRVRSQRSWSASRTRFGAARRAREQRRDHAARAVRRGGRRHRAAHDRHQRPRGDARDEARAAALRRPRQGHLINIASAAGKSPYPGGATYCGTKYFVVGVSETVRGELRGTGVDLSVVMPVVVDTELASGLGTARGIPIVQPEDVAAAIVETLRRPRFDVYVPSSIGPLTALSAITPRRLREFDDARDRSRPRALGRPRPAGRDTSFARPAPSPPWTPARADAVAPSTGRSSTARAS